MAVVEWEKGKKNKNKVCLRGNVGANDIPRRTRLIEMKYFLRHSSI